MSSAYRDLRHFLHEKSGICLGPEKNYLLDSRLPALLRQHRMENVEQLLERLRCDSDGPLASGLISALATHETYWFRDQRAFDVLSKKLLPVWRARDSRRLNIWSAACSSGQEIYSVAMLLAQEGLLEPGYQTTLLASDICEVSLQQASSGCYSPVEIERGLPAPFLHRWFKRIPGGWQIDARLQQCVQFEQINLLQLPVTRRQFDVIFCRNVLIYFDQNTQMQVLRALHSRLHPGGWLFWVLWKVPCLCALRFLSLATQLVFNHRLP